MIAARAEMPLNLQDRTWHCVYGEERLRTTPGYVRSPFSIYLQGWALCRQRTVDRIGRATAAFCVFECCSFGCWALQEQWSWEARSAAFHLVSFCMWVFCSSPQSRIQAYLIKIYLHNSLYKLYVASPSCALLSGVIGGLAEHVSFCLLFWTCSWITLVALGRVRDSAGWFQCDQNGISLLLARHLSLSRLDFPIYYVPDKYSVSRDFTMVQNLQLNM